MSQQEFDDAMCVLKIQRLDEEGVAAAYSDLGLDLVFTPQNPFKTCQTQSKLFQIVWFQAPSWSIL